MAVVDGPLGSALCEEEHFGRRMRCFSERPENLVALFAANVAVFPDRPAVIEEQTLSYRALDRLVQRVATGLAARGVRKGDRVALFLGNCWQFVAAFLACNRLGAIVVPIGIRQQRAELEFLLNDSGARMIIHEADLAHLVPSVAEAASVVLRIAVHGTAPGSESFDMLLEGDEAVTPLISHEDDVAVILYTSGTTGKPKGAQLTHLGMIHTALTFGRCYGLTERDRGLVAVPLSHVTGLVAVMLTMLAVGGCAVLMRREFKTVEFLELASRERITYTLAVPTIYTLCAMHPEFASFDLSAWRIGSFGGAPMPVPTIEALAEKLPKLELINAYGATETTSPAAIMPRADWRDHMDSVGKPVPCGEIKVVDDAGHPVSAGEPGELWIAGPMVVPGYWNRFEANASEFIDGFWRSGDIGSMDADGFVKVFDRKKDMINRGGFKVFCAEVENTIAGLPGVAECAVIGRPDPVLGERVHAIIVSRADGGLSKDAVTAFCATRMADYKVPEIVTLRTEPLPRNANGKIQKALLRKLSET